MFSRKTIAALAMCATAGFVPMASADTITVSYDSVTGSPGSYVFNYAVTLIEPVNTSTPGADSRMVAGNFFTIYDFGFVNVAGSTIPAGWVLTQSLTGVNVPTVSPFDDPTVFNVTLTWTGGTVDAPTDLGIFSFATFAPTAALKAGAYASVDLLELIDNDIEDSGSPFVPSYHSSTVPIPVDAFVPLPSAAWGGLALLGVIAGDRIRRARKAAK